MNSKILITCDSTTDLSNELKEKHGIKVLPLRVTIGNDTYIDGVDIHPDFIYEQYAERKILPQTSAPNIEDCIEFFRPFIEQGYSIVHFTISSEMSSSYQNSVIAAAELGNIHVVDTRNLSTGGGLLVMVACDLLTTGNLTAGEIADACRNLHDCVDSSFVIDSLEFLHKGGRCSAIAALGANLLKLKPCIIVRNGNMQVGKKYRGNYASVLQKYIADQLQEIDTIDPTRVFITHAGCSDQIVQQCIDQVTETTYFKEICVTRAGCTVSSHCGPDTLGILFIRKEKLL